MAFEDERPSEPLLAFGGEGDGNLVPDVFFTFDCRKKFETSFQPPAMTKEVVYRPLYMQVVFQQHS